MTDLSIFQKYIELGSSLGGEVGRFFVIFGPYFIGAIIISLIISGLTIFPPLKRIIAYIKADATRAHEEPPLLMLMEPRTRIKAYYVILFAILFSCIVYILLFLGAIYIGIGVWFYLVGEDINRFGVSALACLPAPVSIFLLWVQAQHVNRYASLIHRVRSAA